MIALLNHAATARQRDKRARPRYPIALKIQWREMGTNSRFVEGLSLDISSGGVLVDSGAPAVVGMKVEIKADWPARIDGISLRLCIEGYVVRVMPSGFAVEFSRVPEFRTAGTS